MYNNPFIYNTKPSILTILKNINWGNFLGNANKTLGVINQAIPIVYQIKPIINNAKTVFKIANSINKNNNITEKKTETNISNKNSYSPIFYL